MSNQAYNGIYGVRADAAAIAAHETSQAAMLDQMRDRLAALTEEARSIRAQMPNEFGPDVERIQQQMHRLGERLSDLGRGALVPYNLADPEKRTASARFKAIRYVTEDDVRVARVTPDEVIALGDRYGMAHRVPAQPMPRHRASPADASAYIRDHGQHLDEAAASALMRLYESGEAFNEARHEMAAPVRARAQSSPGSRPPQAMPQSRGGAMGMQTSDDARAAPRGCAIDSGVLDQRFAEIAARIEESLAQIHPDKALASLSRRFDDLEAQITGMAGQMATRADIEEIRALEGQIEEIAGHLEQFRRQLARLDMIDAHLGTLTSQLSDERLTRLINEGVQVTDVGRLDAIDAQLRIIAVQLSDERLCGLVSRNANRELDYDDLADATARRVMTNFTEMTSGSDAGNARDIGEMRGMIESLIAERRNSDENNASMLDTMQQAIIRVLDRIDELEETHRQAAQQAAEAAATVSSSVAAITAPAQSSSAYAVDHYADVDAQPVRSQRAAGYGRSLQEVVAAAEPVEEDYDPLAQAAPPAPQPIATPAQAMDEDDLIPATARVFAQMPSSSRPAAAAPAAPMAEPVVIASQSAGDEFRSEGAEEQDDTDFLPLEDVVEANVRAYREDAAAEKAPRVPVYTTSGFDLDAAFSRTAEAETENFGDAKRSMEVLRHDFIADAHRAKLKAAARPEAADADLRAGKLSVAGDEGPSKPRARRSIFSFRSQRAAMGLLILLAAIPAAIFFMPRTTTSAVVEHPTATIAPAPADFDDGSTATIPAEIEPAPLGGVAPAPAQRENQIVPPIEQGANEFDGAPMSKDGPFETAAIPNGITMQEGGVSPEQLAQMSEQARMAYLSGQLGIAAAQTTPAALMEQNILQQHGGAAPSAVAEEEEIVTAPGASKLPPATVGPFSMRLAAAQGDASAQFEVASRLAEGKGTDQDLREAAQWYQRSAANGFALAQFRLATLYERGLGVKADRQRAQIWYERAATQGNVKAMHNLAVLAASRSPNGDYETAARWFKAASEHGLADSQYNLAVLYENGMGVKQDLEESYKWLILAAKGGDTDAAGRRDTIKKKLDAKAASAVEQGAAAWRAKPMQNMVNDARLAGQAWQGGAKRG